MLAHRGVRLAVFVGLLNEIGRIATVADRFFGKEMRFHASFVDEELAEIEIFLLSGHTGELDQCELDFLVATIAAKLAFAPTEGLCQVVGIAAHDVEQLALACRLEVSHRGFDQVAGAVEFVMIAQVGPAAVRLDALEPGVQVAAGVLHRLIHVDDLVDARL
jgi:hypothetical protein